MRIGKQIWARICQEASCSRLSAARNFAQQCSKPASLRLLRFGALFGTLAWAAYSTNSFQASFLDELVTVATADNLAEGEIREVHIGPKPEDTILVINYQGSIYATQSKCSHYGFSLAKGLLVGDKILCPLHNAGFSITSGQAEQGPVFSGLQTFPVQRKDGQILVTLPKEGWASSPKPKQCDLTTLDAKRQIVIVGSGPAALSAAETLRDSGYKGFIYLVSKEAGTTSHAEPYDRTTLSKGLNGKPASPIRSYEELLRQGIFLVSGANAVGLSPDKNELLIEGKSPLPFEKLLIATGSRNRVPPIPGLANSQFFTLRDNSDNLKIWDRLSQPSVKHLVIVGGGFIGMELASAVKTAFKEKIDVTVLEGAEFPMEKAFGREVGSVVKSLGEANGVKVITKSSVESIDSEHGVLKGVQANGVCYPADALVIATGAEPVVDWVKELTKPGLSGIPTNPYLETARKDVYAAGDVANFKYWYSGKNTRIEHFNEAIYQGSVAALNMAGRRFPLDNIPFFWTRLFNNSVVFTGVAEGWDEVHVEGSLAEKKFVAYYIRKADDKVLAAAAMNQPNSIQIINEAMLNGVMPKASEVREAGFTLTSLLSKIKTTDPKCKKCGRVAATL